jgi:putative spermidine/putrescine transport system ATP-binding protein
MSFVSLRGLEKRFGSTIVFSGIDLDIERGEMCVLVGPSGCGKTTLLRAVAGLTSQDRGSISIDGRDVSNMAAQHRGVGMVFQNYALFPNMNVEQNLSFGLEHQRLPANEVKSRVAAMVELMGLGPRSKARPSALSGGQRQRVALARALVMRPKLLLLDEPMSALDAKMRKRLREELKRLQAEIAFTAIFVTHDQEEALVLGDRIAVMHEGRFSQVGTASDIYNRPASRAVAEFIGEFNVLGPHEIDDVFQRTSTSTWAIHPESIMLHCDLSVSSSENRMSGQATVVARRLLGSIVRYVLQSGSVQLKADQLNKPSQDLIEVGQAVTFAIDSDDVRHLDT